MAKTTSASRARKAYSKTSSKMAGFSNRKLKVVGSSKALKIKSSRRSGIVHTRTASPMSLSVALPEEVLVHIPKPPKPPKLLKPPKPPKLPKPHKSVRWRLKVEKSKGRCAK